MVRWVISIFIPIGKLILKAYNKYKEKKHIITPWSKKCIKQLYVFEYNQCRQFWLSKTHVDFSDAF